MEAKRAGSEGKAAIVGNRGDLVEAVQDACVVMCLCGVVWCGVEVEHSALANKRLQPKMPTRGSD